MSFRHLSPILLRRGLVAAAVLLSAQAQAVVSSGNPSDWVLNPGAMGGALDGVAQVLYTNSGGAWACSGSLLAGGAWVLTAAHCATDFSSMSVQLLGGSVSRTVTSASVLPQWAGWNGTGTDLALLKLDHAVTGVAGFHISTGSHLYQDYLLAGYGYIGTGAVGGDTYNSSGLAPYGYNTWDTTDDALNQAVFGNNGGGTSHGVSYVSDFDDGSAAHNTLYQETFYGSKDGSSAGLGAREGFMTGGDSGGGNFVLQDGQWVLAGVHASGWVICGCFDANGSYFGSYGELNEATAVYPHAAWIASVAGDQVLVSSVPEAGTAPMVLAGLALLGGLGWRRAAPGGAQRQRVQASVGSISSIASVGRGA
ncbi:MAG: peptidase S1/S6 [Burkholderiales bacterium PBB5]|nr:MAG: peptidase S1/S6 [Burkholderiales bacterium PBB5]